MPQSIDAPRCHPSIRVGVPNRDYNANRNILGSIPGWAQPVRPIDRHRLEAGIRARLNLKKGRLSSGTFSDPYAPGVDLLHLFNAVGFTQTPWITTFETMLPRWGDVVLPDWDLPDNVLRRATGAMASDRCRALVAMSESARRLVRRRWSARIPSADLEALDAKLIVLNPPQDILVDPGERHYGDKPRFVFVGSEFYRKGGLALLEALGQLWQRGLRDWTAVLVGRLESFGDRASRSTASDASRARDLIGSMAPAIRHCTSLPRGEVLKTMSESDFYVLPTLQDSFGYGVLEAQACGAVTITTNIRALPEMQAKDGGLMVNLALDADGEVHHDASLMPRVIADLQERLASALADAVRMNSAERRARAESQQRHLRANYSPETHRAALARLYAGALRSG